MLWLASENIAACVTLVMFVLLYHTPEFNPEHSGVVCNPYAVRGMAIEMIRRRRRLRAHPMGIVCGMSSRWIIYLHPNMMNLKSSALANAETQRSRTFGHRRSPIWESPLMFRSSGFAKGSRKKKIITVFGQHPHSLVMHKAMQQRYEFVADAEISSHLKMYPRLVRRVNIVLEVSGVKQQVEVITSNDDLTAELIVVASHADAQIHSLSPDIVPPGFRITSTQAL
ncbi:hypothetical protein C8J56DRAFT_890831 [Mycena floridula]|nr:hypothetical protein C8J56DRAFT_890831 [Mycena floridula]